MSQNLENLKIAFIGGGNMGQALVGGLLSSDWIANNISIIDSDPAMSAKLAKQFMQCNVFTQTEAVLTLADIVVLAVKPQTMRTACEQIAAQCQASRPLIISIAAGIQISAIDDWLGGELPIVRCMPNTPALVQSGTTGLFANSEASLQQREFAQNILNSVGSTLWLEQEAMLDVVTAISGSGPAYFFYVIEAMLEAGQSLGLSAAQARQLTIDTAAGAAKLIQKSGKTPQELRRAVTSKGGTTEAAIKALKQGGMKNLFHTAITIAAQKAKQLARTNALTNSDEANSEKAE